MTWIVSDVMTRDVVTVEPSASFDACVRMMRMHGVGALPVVIDGQVEGIVSMTDLVMKGSRPSVRERYEGHEQGNGHGGLTAAGLMSRRLATVYPDTPLAVAVRQMFQRGVNRLPVVDHDHRLVGIVSRSDVLRMFLRSDLAIRREVNHAMAEDLPFIGKGTIFADVQDGVVTLQGDVEPGTLTDVLLRLVASVPGVVGVKSRLKVRRARAGAAHA